MTDAMPNGVPADVGEIARGTLGGASAVSAQLPGEVGAALLGTARDAFVQAFVTTAAVNAALVFAAAVAATLLLRRSQNLTRESEQAAA
jgi:DHA2 family multidrug resistance protein-like MFS transporter